MSDISRRDALRRLGLALMTTGCSIGSRRRKCTRWPARREPPSGGAYTPEGAVAHEYQTLERLTDLIIPVENGEPGAVAAGAAAWIDMMASENEQLKGIYTTGLAWLDTTMTEPRREGLSQRHAGAADRAARPHRVPSNQSPGARSGHRVLHLGAAHDRRRLLHQRDRHQGHRLPGNTLGSYPGPDGSDRVCAEAQRAGLGHDSRRRRTARRGRQRPAAPEVTIAASGCRVGRRHVQAERCLPVLSSLVRCRRDRPAREPTA